MQWIDDDLVVGDVKVHYARAGQGSPVLLLHGVTENGRCWGRTADALAQAHDVVLLDQRGHGQSAAPSYGYRMADFAGDAAGLLQALGLQDTAVVGHSMGAIVGLTLAVQHPDLVTRLVLAEPALYLDLAPVHLYTHCNQASCYLFDSLRCFCSRARDELLEYRHAKSPNWRDDECAAWVDAKLQVSLRFLESGETAPLLPWRREMAQVTCPVLLIRGDASMGSHVTREHAAEILELLQHGTDVHITGAGHSVHRDRFDAFMAEVGPFLSADNADSAAA